MLFFRPSLFCIGIDTDLVELQTREVIMFIKTYNSIMRRKHNPLSNIPDVATGHLVMQVLAWMWCIIFSMWMGSVYVFGVTAIAHALLIAGVFITAAVFFTAKTKPTSFDHIRRG